MYNEIFEHKVYVALDTDYDMLAENVNEAVHCDLYSYFVGRKDDLIVIKTVTSAEEEWNTIKRDKAREDIMTSVINYFVTLSNSKCICFGRPPLELTIRLYQPMLQKMAAKLNNQWKHFEYEDLVAIGNYVIVKLYNEGYYVNKSLVWTSLNNEVLMECRKFKHQPNNVSFEDMTKSKIKIDDEKLTYGDMIKDESYEEEKEREDGQQLEKYIFEQVKNIIIDKIGIRRWDRLWRDYSKSHADVATRQEMKKLKSFFEELGLTRQDFINYYRR